MRHVKIINWTTFIAFVTLFSHLAFAEKAVLLNLKHNQVPKEIGKNFMSDLGTQLQQEFNYEIYREDSTLTELSLINGCLDINQDCLILITESFQANILIFGTLDSNGHLVLLQLSQFNLTTANTIDKIFTTEGGLKEFNLEKTLLIKRFMFGNMGSISISSPQDPVEILLDGVPVGNTPLVIDNVLYGKHLLKGRKEGYNNLDREVEVYINELTQEKFELTSTGSIVSLDPPIKDNSENPPNHPKRRWTWITAGVGLAAVAGGVITSLVLNSTQKEFDTYLQNDFLNRQHIDNLQKSGENQALVANILYLGGAVFLITSTVLFFLEGRETDKTPPEEGVKVDFDVRSDYAGLRFRFTF